MEIWILLFYLCISLPIFACTHHGNGNDHRDHIDQMFEKNGDRFDDATHSLDETIKNKLNEIDESVPPNKK